MFSLAKAINQSMVYGDGATSLFTLNKAFFITLYKAIKKLLNPSQHPGSWTRSPSSIRDLSNSQSSQGKDNGVSAVAVYDRCSK